MRLPYAIVVRTDMNTFISIISNSSNPLLTIAIWHCCMYRYKYFHKYSFQQHKSNAPVVYVFIIFMYTARSKYKNQYILLIMP